MAYTSQFTGAEIDAKLISVSENIENIQNEIVARTEAVEDLQEQINLLGSSMINTLALRGRVASVEELPTTASVGDLYLVGTEDADIVDEYLYTDDGCFQCVSKAGPTIDDLNNETTARKEVDNSLDTRIKSIEDGYVKPTDKLILKCTL